MASPTMVGSDTQDSFGSYRLAFAPAVSLGSTGNAVIALPVLGGGIGGAFGNGSYTLRRITVTNPANAAGGSVMNMSTANVAILTSSDGNTSNAVTTAVGQTLTSMTGANTWMDLVLIGGNTNVTTTLTAGTALTAPALFLKVNTAVANATVNISVFGDVVNF